MANEITWRLEHERIGRLLLHYAMPAVIGTMVNALYNIVDRIFIGQGVGPLAMAGLTLTFPILLFLQAFGMLIGAGAATRVSRIPFPPSIWDEGRMRWRKRYWGMLSP